MYSTINNLNETFQVGSPINLASFVRDWIEKHKEDLQKNDFDCAYMRSVMPIPEVCFLLKRVLTNKTASFWRGVFTELRSRQVEVSLNDGKFEFAGERWGWEKI
ncbi:hypothetical protein HDU92_007507 [Lobulomyces angularis]|nr:hypothetical protein HDU92_007507 [Lobulomyces angularis]